MDTFICTYCCKEKDTEHFPIKHYAKCDECFEGGYSWLEAFDYYMQDWRILWITIILFMIGSRFFAIFYFQIMKWLGFL